MRFFSSLVAWAPLFLCLACAPAEHKKEEPPTVTLHDMEMHNYRGEQLVSKGRAQEAAYVRTAGEFSASGVWLSLPRPGRGEDVLRGDMEVRSPQMVGNLRTRQAEGRGGVAMRSSDGVTARSDVVRFDGMDKSAAGDTRIHVDAPHYALEADSFYLSFDDQQFRFRGKVESRLGASIDGGAR